MWNLKYYLYASIALIQTLHPASGFSGWLPCHRHLEEDEVIMNTKVVRAPPDTENVVLLAVYDSTGSRVDKNSIVWIDEGVVASSKYLSFRISMDASTVKDLADIQFVVETNSFNESASTDLISPATRTPISRVSSVPTPYTLPLQGRRTGFTGASSGGGVLCNGKRSHTRGKHGFINYELTVHKVEKGQTVAEVWAGWAEGHKKVTLTPKVHFKVGENTPTGGQNDEL